MSITLKTLHLATAQQVFDQVARHLLTQGAQSGYIDDEYMDFVCQYRDASGRMCAAGCLIADSEYRPLFEGKSWDAGMVDTGAVTRSHADLITDLQCLHDERRPYEWSKYLRALAARYALDDTVVEEFEP